VTNKKEVSPQNIRWKIKDDDDDDVKKCVEKTRRFSFVLLRVALFSGEEEFFVHDDGFKR
tara:strand:+ start:423 stop:602 length:180 start_codon:yes stop_codon:yes gene_type:complete